MSEFQLRSRSLRSPLLRRHHVVETNDVVDPFDSVQGKTFHLVRCRSYQQGRTPCDNQTPMNTSAVRPADPYGPIASRGYRRVIR